MKAPKKLRQNDYMTKRLYLVPVKLKHLKAAIYSVG
jgi:hypothetical protein